MKGCDRTQMGLCLIHKSSLLSLSLSALDALLTEEADRFTNVSVINCGFYIDLHQQIGEWSAFTPEPIQCLSFSAIINDSEVINLHVLKIKLIVLFRHAVPAARRQQDAHQCRSQGWISKTLQAIA